MSYLPRFPGLLGNARFTGNSGLIKRQGNRSFSFNMNVITEVVFLLFWSVNIGVSMWRFDLVGVRHPK